jgi:hypothetical protein
MRRELRPIHPFYFREENRMDLRSYYQKIREADQTLDSEHVVMVSLPTTEGGKAGVKTEVPRAIAARLIAEQRSRVATEEETLAFHEANRVAQEDYEDREAARRLQVMVIPAQDLKKQKDRS